MAERLGYSCNHEEAKAARMFLEHVRALPKDAEEIICTEAIGGEE